jgi:hypothetical protein
MATPIIPDARALTDDERRALCEILYSALVRIRSLGGAGKATEASDLADALHNVPHLMWNEDFSLNWLRTRLARYEQLYPGQGTEYLEIVDEIIKKK